MMIRMLLMVVMVKLVLMVVITPTKANLHHHLEPDFYKTIITTITNHHHHNHRSFQLEPEVYKTRKDENFTEYFKVDISFSYFFSWYLTTSKSVYNHHHQDDLLLMQVGKNKSYTKVAEGPHFVSESKEVQQQEDRQVG